MWSITEVFSSSNSTPHSLPSSLIGSPDKHQQLWLRKDYLPSCVQQLNWLSFIFAKWRLWLATKDGASDISRKKKQNFAGFSGANSWKNRPISRHFRGKKVKIRGTIGRFREIFAGEKSKFAEKSAHFAGFLRKEVNFRRIFGGKFLGKSADFTGNFGGKLRQETISKKQPISLDFFGKFC